MPTELFFWMSNLQEPIQADTTGLDLAGGYKILQSPYEGKQGFWLFFDSDDEHNRWQQIGVFSWNEAAKILQRQLYTYPEALPMPNSADWRSSMLSYDKNPTLSNPCHEAEKNANHKNFVKTTILYEIDLTQPLEAGGSYPLNTAIFKTQMTEKPIKVVRKITKITEPEPACTIEQTDVLEDALKIKKLALAPPTGIEEGDIYYTLLSLATYET